MILNTAKPGGAARPIARMQKPANRAGTIALALSGGGLRGMAHIGVLKVLAENGIRPSILAGTSAGSIVAALYAAGLEPDEIEELATTTRAHDIYDPTLNPWSGFQIAAKLANDYLHIPMLVPPQAPLGLVRGDKLERLIADKTGNKTFAQTRIPVAITAVDINTGQQIVFCDEHDIFPDATGKVAFITGATLAEAVRASVAIPGVFEPKALAGRMLVDGGVKDFVPVDILAKMGARPVVAVDLGLADQRPADIDDILEVMQQAFDIIGRELTNIILRRYATVVIAPKTGDVGLADLQMIPEIICRGEVAARVSLRQLSELT